jgi:putative toxin-antitoxin system toxin component, PIN family
LRAVVDVNVLISALLSSSGAPAAVLRAWLDGHFELIVSPLLLEELERALAYPKLRRRIPVGEAKSFVDWLRQTATADQDPSTKPPLRSADPGDDYLIALAASKSALIISGDGHLLELAPGMPVYSPAEFMLLVRGSGNPVRG